MGQIPVVGQFVGILKNIGKIAKSIGQSDKSRTNEKLGRANLSDSRANERLDEIDALLERLDEMDLSDVPRADRDRLLKARRRQLDLLNTIDGWKGKKRDHGTMPLLADSQDAGESSFDFDEIGGDD